MPIALKRLRFSDSVASHSRLLCAAIEDSSRSGRRRAMIKGGVEAVFREEEIEERFPDGTAEAFTCVMKFGGSSVASAKRMREIADLILSFPEERPAVVLSAMGKTTNKLLQVFHTHTHTQNILFCYIERDNNYGIEWL
jgi:aspartate kinase